MEPVNLHNLEHIQEQEAPPTSRWWTFLLASAGGAAIVVALVVFTGNDEAPAIAKKDPLSGLIAQARRDGPAPEELQGDVTFPAVLSDHSEPTTALAAVKDERGRLIERQVSPEKASQLPLRADKLPKTSLPVGTLLHQTAITREPKDKLTRLAKDVTAQATLDEAPAGSSEGYQLQVASFKDKEDADRLVAELRRRGHAAFRMVADVPDRGIWHRVRIGPFDNKYQANRYKTKFEASERLSPFVVDPDQVRRAEELRRYKLELRIRKYGRP